MTGSTDPDTLNVNETNAGLPAVTFNAGMPAASPGDTLNINLKNATTPNLTRTFSRTSGYSGSWTFGNRNTVNFTGVESLLPAEVSTAVLKTTGELDLLQPQTGVLQASYPRPGPGPLHLGRAGRRGRHGCLRHHQRRRGAPVPEHPVGVQAGRFRVGSNCPPAHSTISAATNSAGQAVVFGVLTNGALYEQDPADPGPA